MVFIVVVVCIVVVYRIVVVCMVLVVRSSCGEMPERTVPEISVTAAEALNFGLYLLELRSYFY